MELPIGTAAQERRSPGLALRKGDGRRGCLACCSEQKRQEDRASICCWVLGEERGGVALVDPRQPGMEKAVTKPEGRAGVPLPCARETEGVERERRVGVGTSSTASASVAVAENAQAAATGDSRGDPAWKYCTLPDMSKKYQLKCIFCQQLCSGGITRVKYHLAHIPKSGVAKCPKVPTDVKDMMHELLTKNKAKKQNKCKEKASARAEVNLSDSEEESSEEEGGNSVVVLNPGRAGSATSSKGGPMERFSKPTIEDATTANKGTSLSNKVQTKLSTQKREERRDRACEYISQFFYEASIPHNVVNLPSFDLMLEAIGDFGRYLKGPSAYELSGPLLKKAKDKVRDSVKKHKEQWALTGCSLMTDAWTDKRGRGVMNLVVHSNYGVHFVDSVDCSSVKKDGKYIFELVDKCIEEIGEKNVVQVVTDNASPNMAASTLLKAKRPSIFWNGCAAHTIDLMLEDIGKIKQVDQTIVRAKSLTAFLYSHTRVLALMREFLGKDLVRAGVTRFALLQPI
ncbi:hypothetical protein U9M48_030776 [Paspalum notatum var. saurae]|uniref:BED-type domain-containing protein n=1 Tax=Paspalum notatum var. saurae TaxID=547442 RepID=A0AAQ3U1J6_PASNO